MSTPGLLAVHGFVLAGGKSSRMGCDKALLSLDGRTLIEIAVQKLAGFCSEVSIAGNRPDLTQLAPVAIEARLDAGPGAGVEAGLAAAAREWCVFLPVDVPLLPAELLRQWVGRVIMEERVQASYLTSQGRAQPSICMLRRSCAGAWSEAMNRGERRLTRLFEAVEKVLGAGSLRVWDAAEFGGAGDSFLNVNTAADFAEARAKASTNAESAEIAEGSGNFPVGE